MSLGDSGASGPLTCKRRGPLRGSISVPGDKSVSHRALLFGALSTGETRITGLLDAEDVHSTRKAVERLGALVRVEGAEVVVVPPERLREPDDVIDCGNSGTSLRLLTGVLSGVPGLSVLTGDASLRKRPVRRVIDPLRAMGATLSARDGDRVPPVVVRGGPLRGRAHALAVASAQVKSAILLAGLLAEGETSVTEPERSRDHTERMLTGMGVPVRLDGTQTRGFHWLSGRNRFGFRSGEARRHEPQCRLSAARSTRCRRLCRSVGCRHRIASQKGDRRGSRQPCL
jgi:3-phosphoshikimate 1-carboxyvinyltransferase